MLKSVLEADTSYICCVCHRPGKIVWPIEHYILKKVERWHTSSWIAPIENIIGCCQVGESISESIRWYFQERVIFSTQERLDYFILLMEHY